MPRRIRPMAAAMLCLALAACQSTSPQEAFDDSQSLIQQATGQRAQWRGRSADDATLDAAVDKLLASPLSIDGAVQVALLSNRTMQAEFEELGIARAELVQAGLLKNPVFDASIRWPSASPSGTNVEFAVVQDFISVLLIPMKKKVAAAKLHQAVHRVTHQAIELAADVKAAYIELHCLKKLASIKDDDALAAEAAGELAERLRKAGNIPELELLRRRATLESARIELAETHAHVAEGREKLLALLGLTGREATFSDAVPALPRFAADLPPLETLALARRQDLAAQRSALLAQMKSRQLTKTTSLIPELEIGGDGEREVDGNWLAGPTISLPLPLFDQGQAQVAKADAEQRRASFELEAVEQKVRSETRLATLRARSTGERLRAIEDRLLPLRNKVFEEAQTHNNGMLLSTFELLEARQSQLEAEALRARALADHWASLASLERAIAGPLPSDAPATQPDTQPAAPH